MENRKMYSNRVMITGFLGRDAETHTTRNDSSFTTLSVATKRSWKNRETGDYESQTTWHRCVVFGPQATFAATLLKGAHVQIEGELRTREYTEKPVGKQSAPVKKTATEIRVFRVVKLDRTGKSASEGAAA
jgi:single-strand DNA-binding protein